MKPSERIQQIAQPIIDQAIAQARAQIEALEGRPITDAEWQDFVGSREFSPEVRLLQTNAQMAALLQYLDEREQLSDEIPGV